MEVDAAVTRDDMSTQKARDRRKRYKAAHPEQVKRTKQKYNRTHKEQIRRSKQEYNKTHKEQIRNYSINYRDSSFENRLKRSIASIASHNKKVGIDCNINLEYILDLLRIQDGYCAATELKMTHKIGDMKAVSIDRIDSAKGHIKGNIQLVCQFYNLGKRERPDIEARAFIQEIRMDQLRKLKAGGYLKL